MLNNAAKGGAWAMEAVPAANFHSSLNEFFMKICQASAQVMDSDQVVSGETIFRYEFQGPSQYQRLVVWFSGFFKVQIQTSGSKADFKNNPLLVETSTNMIHMTRRASKILKKIDFFGIKFCVYTLEV